MGHTSHLQPMRPGDAVAVPVGAGCCPPRGAPRLPQRWGGGGGGGELLVCAVLLAARWHRGHGDLLSAEAFVPLGRRCLILLIAVSIRAQRKVKGEKSLPSSFPLALGSAASAASQGPGTRRDSVLAGAPCPGCSPGVLGREEAPRRGAGAGARWVSATLLGWLLPALQRVPSPAATKPWVGAKRGSPLLAPSVQSRGGGFHPGFPLSGGSSVECPRPTRRRCCRRGRYI